MEKSSNNSRTVLTNLIWRFFERFGAQGVSFLVQLIIARIVAPEIYGTVALVTVFTNILNIFVDSGLGNALIQKKNADELDFSTVFFFNICVCTVLYVLMYFSSSLIARFYDDVSLVPVIRVLSLSLIVSGIKNVQQAYVSRTMQFRRFFFATLIGTIGAAILGIALAYSGFGVWALVSQQLFNATVDTIILWVTVKWRPKRRFSFNRLKVLFAFGWKLLISSLINQVYMELRQLIIGKRYTTTDLAYYNRGRQFPFFFINNINAAIDSVLLPVLSKEQDDLFRIKEMTRRAIKTSTYIIAPLMIGLIVIADSFVELLLTSKWLPCVPYLRIFCLTFIFYPINTANLNAIKAMGKSNYFLKLEIIKSVVGMIILFSSMWFGVLAMAYSMLITSIVSQIINSWPNKRFLKYGYFEQIKDILPGLFLAAFMGGCVYLLSFLKLPPIVLMIIQVFLGILIYWSGSIVLKIEPYLYIVYIIKQKKQQN